MTLEEARAYVSKKETYAKMMLWARSMCTNKFDADDIVQDTCIKVLMRYDKFVGGNLDGWVHQIMKFTFLDWVDKEKNNTSSISYDDFGEIADTSEEKCYEMFDELSFNAAMSGIRENYRKALEMFFFGYSYAEIGKEFGWTPRTVGNIILNGRKQLQKVYR